MNRLYEKKDSLIRKNPNLTEEQKQEIIAVLNRHPSYESKIDWNKNNKLTYEDFLTVLRPLYINDLDFRGLVEGVDYGTLLDKPNEKLYFIHTYNASKIIASNSVEPKIWTPLPYWCGKAEFTDEAHAFGYFDSEHGKMKPGAKWCISMQTSTKYWSQYSNDFYFIFWIRDDESLGDNQKIAISIHKKTGRVATIYNASDDRISLDLPQYIEGAINESFNNLEEKRKQVLLFQFKLNPETGRYDYDGDLEYSILKEFVPEDRNGFTINFGKITGYFDCSELGLTSLEGAPTEVGGNFFCYRNQLTSLEGAPTEVGGTFICTENRLTSLEGAPQKVNGDFDCCKNKLTSLEGAPQKVGRDFYCNNNKLTSLEGAPKEVGRDFNCSLNNLISLEGAPTEVGRNFYCSDNKLTSLKGAPTEVGGYFDCSWNNLISLKGAPQEVGGNFWCPYNPKLHSLEGIGNVKGRIYKNF